MSFNLRNRHFLTLRDYTPAEIGFLLKLSADLKAAKYAGTEQPLLKGREIALDLVDAMVVAADDSYTDAEVEAIEKEACPTCGSCSGMFTANSMNCLTEALGLSLPGNGSTLATHADRKRLFEQRKILVGGQPMSLAEYEARVNPRWREQLAERDELERKRLRDIGAATDLSRLGPNLRAMAGRVFTPVGKEGPS